MNKLKWVLGITLVFFLILATNLIDQRNFNQIKDSVETIYKDRLLTKNMVFELSTLTHEKVVALALSDSDFYKERNPKIDDRIDEIVADFEGSYKNESEFRALNRFKGKMNALRTSEDLFMNDKAAYTELKSTGEISRQIYGIERSLQRMSEIQLIEGQRQMAIGKKAVDTIELITQMEIYVLIFLAIVVPLVIIIKPNRNNYEYTQEDVEK